MSDSDGFINEVSDAVRQDQLYKYVRRYGWIAGLAILLLVGGAAWNEYNKAQAVTAAKNVGDGLMDALSLDSPEARAEAIADVQAEGQAASVAQLMTAATQQEAGDLDAAVATLDALAVNPDVAPIYRDLAAIKSALMPVGEDADRRNKLDALAQPGNTFRLLALEQLALLDIQAGERDSGIATFRAIIEDADVTRGLRERAQTMIVALGEELEATTTDQ